MRIGAARRDPYETLADSPQGKTLLTAWASASVVIDGLHFESHNGSCHAVVGCAPEVTVRNCSFRRLTICVQADRQPDG